ncbi:uncharacterized protein PAE49_019632 [Odontesthes bonariensis]|uniref:uncharacterized protein LOC142366157 n=1 Tax=Odontesthes bonariensis TaxID=219752 RepID=UPI003F5822E3
MDRLRVKIKKCITPGSKYRRRNGTELLIEKNNNDIQDGYLEENPTVHNCFNIDEERFLQRCNQSCDDGNRYSVQPKSDLSQNFPKAPPDLDQNLKQHLLDLKEAVFNVPECLNCSLTGESRKWATDRYHHQIISYLHILLQNITLSKNTLMLMNWVLHTYLSQEVLVKPDPQLLEEWEAKAKDKLFKSVQKDISESLLKILQADRSQKCANEETYVGLYIDIIQCINAVLKEAGKLSSGIFDKVREVCFQELHTFVKGYTEEQAELLTKSTQRGKESMNELETILFLKTLKTCKEIKTYIQTEGAGIQHSILEETLDMLEKMETLTLKLLMEVIADDAERHFKDYFKTGSGWPLKLAPLKTQFPKLTFVLDEQKMVMDEAYKFIAHAYLKHLIQTSKRKLKRWDTDVAQRVYSDANKLHKTFSDLAPGVQPWNSVLLGIPEVLECESIDGLKITMATIQTKGQSKDLELFPALLRWKGLSKGKVREVVEALPDRIHQTSSGSMFSGLFCCC